MQPKKCVAAIITERIEQKIFLIRDKKVMLDSDLAELYKVETKQLKRAVRRHLSRFPDDFMFTLSSREFRLLRCQNGTLKKGAHSKYLPYVFTEQGVAMLSSILNSERAIEVNIQIMRTFTKLRELMIAHKDLNDRINALEGKYDRQFKVVFDTIRKFLMPPPATKKLPIGFHVRYNEEGSKQRVNERRHR